MTDTTTSGPSPLVHTADEAIERFELIAGPGSLAEGRACSMTAISWMAGEAWSDHPQCAHSVLADMAIRANDASSSTVEQRQAIVRAGADGIIDTWWVPGIVLALAQARPTPAKGEELPDETPVDRCLRVLAAVAAWKALGRPRLTVADLGFADLGSADLRSANLRSANLRSADLRSANLRSADLRSANLRSANLRSANLRSANLRSADLRSADLGFADLGSADLGSADLRSADLGFADLRSADLRSADLGSANLRSADLRSADLRSADLRSADLRFADLGFADLRSARNIERAIGLTTARGNAATVLPDGWKVDEGTGLIVAVAEVAD